MEEILHHLACLKNLVNHRINYQPQLVQDLVALFPTCQVRVVRFYVSLFSFSSSSSSSFVVLLNYCNWDPLSSVWRAGPQLQLGSSQFSVACWTPTAILWVQCGVLDPNRDAVSSVWRAGPQPRSYEFSVACWTPTAMLWVQCGVLDPNRDMSEEMSKRYVRRYVRKNVKRFVRRYVRKICQKICQKECQKICQKEW